MSLDAFLQTALLGTARSPSMPVVGEGAVAALFEKIQKSTSSGATDAGAAASVFLKSVACATLCARAGFVPKAMDLGAVPAVPDLSGDLTVVAPIEPLSQVLVAGLPRLSALAFAHMRAVDMRAPGPLIRPLLDHGYMHKELREHIAPIVGARGRWLASQEVSWAWAKGGVTGAADQQAFQEQWDFGSSEARVAALKTERLQNPEGARSRLSAEIKDLPLQERTPLIEALRVNLSEADAPFLMGCLVDKAREPREAAAALLMTLPDSLHAQRMGLRLAALVTKADAGKNGWEIDAPKALDEHWSADGLAVKQPKESAMGQRAWWLLNVVAGTRLGWWTEHTGMDAVQLVKWSQTTEWTEVLVRGWILSLSACPAGEWAEALYHHAGNKSINHYDKALLINLMGQKAKEDQWRKLIKRGDANVWETIVRDCPIGEQLSAAFSLELVNILAKMGAPNSELHRYHLTSAAVNLACCLDASCLSPLIHAKDSEIGLTHIVRAVEQMRSIAKIRQGFDGWIRSKSQAN